MALGNVNNDPFIDIVLVPGGVVACTWALCRRLSLSLASPSTMALSSRTTRRLS